jgi:hypothetical protein
MSQALASPSTWWLAPDVHLAAVDGDLVFLSVGQHAYFCLPDVANTIKVRLGRRELVITDRALASSLVVARLLSTESDEAHFPPVPLPDRPSASAIKAVYRPPAWADIPIAARSTLDVLAGYRGRDFATILASVQRHREETPWPTMELLEVVERFHRWVPYAPVSGKCLLRSFMLLKLLRRAGHDAHWVFGVRTWPFHAHCWLQCGDLVLDDFSDRVAAFTPIMAI